ncbi:RNA polymerase sigma factor [Pontiella sulfatireligans]|nr:sigma-70 family RNA polymerase sigma factor [Pontiella sulfatireligans]
MNEKPTTETEDPNRTRATLIRRVKNQHDDASWEDFDRIYRRYIYAIIRGMNISEHDANDIAQTVLLGMWNKLPNTDVENIRRFRSWLSTITKNAVLDFIRKRTRDTERVHKAEKEDDLTYLKTISLPDIEKIADKEWKLHLTNLALENIKPLFSGHAIEVFQRSLDGMDIKAIAKQLDLQENSVYRLKNRVKKRLIIEIEQLREELE